ncbi:MAG: hypothetical protein FJX74_00910 [Armatimonadetes bacterium]|nr:hypothetical protein [Armatimonadota bacterium]
MTDEGPARAGERSFSDLTVELIEQAAALAGERLSAPIRSASSTAVRMLIVAGLLLAAAGVGLVFLGVAVGLLVGRAPAESQWWVCLLVAAGFFVAAAVTGWLGFRRKSKGRTEESSEPAE